MTEPREQTKKASTEAEEAAQPSEEIQEQAEPAIVEAAEKPSRPLDEVMAHAESA